MSSYVMPVVLAIATSFSASSHTDIKDHHQDSKIFERTKTSVPWFVIGMYLMCFNFVPKTLRLCGSVTIPLHKWSEETD